jgi:hypothetical protein
LPNSAEIDLIQVFSFLNKTEVLCSDCEGLFPLSGQVVQFDEHSDAIVLEQGGGVVMCSKQSIYIDIEKVFSKNFLNFLCVFSASQIFEGLARQEKIKFILEYLIECKALYSLKKELWI